MYQIFDFLNFDNFMAIFRFFCHFGGLFYKKGQNMTKNQKIKNLIDKFLENTLKITMLKNQRSSSNFEEEDPF